MAGKRGINRSEFSDKAWPSKGNMMKEVESKSGTTDFADFTDF